MMATGPSAIVPGKGGNQSSGDVIVTVDSHPVTQRLSLVGTIEPGRIVNVAGPFDGAIREKRVEYGATVAPDQILLVLNTSEVDLKLRDAEVAAIKAARAVEDIKAWSGNAEVVRARNAVLSAQMKADDLARKETQSKTLLDRGIIPKNEYDGVESQWKDQGLQLDAARQDLTAIMKRGDAEHRHLADLELENANKRLGELKRDMEAGNVKAPISGLVLRPAANAGGKDSSPANIDVGSRVAKGQALLTVADTDSLKVVAHVDEIDINRIAEGQAVEVTGDAFGGVTLQGKVAGISAQAAAENGSGSTKDATFDVTVAIASVPPDQRDRVRIGMSANLSVVTYDNPMAMVVPANAIHADGLGKAVTVLDPATGRKQPVSVRVGRSVEDGVEILDGLRPGQQVVTDGTVAPAPALGPSAPAQSFSVSPLPALGGGASLGRL